MTAHWPPADLPAVTAAPVVGGSKDYLDLVDVRGARVPYRRVRLADGRHVDLYDSSGPYTDPDAVLDLERGLPPRPGVFHGRGTQLQQARNGVVTAEMAFVAAREGVRPKLVRDEVAGGRAVIPANHRHPESEPMIIGRAFRVKVTATVGTPSADTEVQDMVRSIRWGADTVLDASAGDAFDHRDRLLRNAPVPIGTDPLHQALEAVDGDPAALSWETFRDTVVEQAEQGVDYMTVPAGVRVEHLSLTAGRASGIVDRGGAIMAAWCRRRRTESFLFTHFEELCGILARYDVTLALGAGLQPGSIADADDAAQFTELRTVGGLAKVARAHGVQVMIEGSGRLPLHAIANHVRLLDQLSQGAPAYAYGPLTTDVALGHEHVAAAIGAAATAQAGTAMLFCLSPAQHAGDPERAVLKDAVVAHRIAAHAADLAKGQLPARQREVELCRARVEHHWHDQRALSVDPDTAYGVTSVGHRRLRRT
ncbi:phosphomethylpyrimidine synthase ThiC [Mycobacterium yunnanensis]|uniref:Phosphomethylpyrimidine synthase ThiC n=1 Tax=Mycobacterium yunnanensis TaxID=368477 RepID=A0A9X2Z0S7_9MYCO|nr:phosphomethylpyrimidine synthase ThiC [Mycobacterium yunnanensis]